MLEVRSITPVLVDDYLEFFDRAFPDNPHWAGCYCSCYDEPGEEWDATVAAGPAHRAAKADHIRSGQAHGLLAYEESRVVGWCNAGPRRSYRTLRAFAGKGGDDPDEPVGLVMCFVIDPTRRRQGLASLLLGEAVTYLRAAGMKAAEGYPRARPPDDPAFPWTAASYKGTEEMFEKAGFSRVGSRRHYLVMRRPL